MKSFPSICTAVCVLVMLLIFPNTAKDAVISGLDTCGTIIIPSLFPFFVAVNLLVELGVIGRICTALHINSIKYAAFMIGITGGYPIGAAYIAESRLRGELSCNDASKLLIYCNNSGPAFIIGAVGIGIFHSTAIGIILYASHIISAAIYGKLFCSTKSGGLGASSEKGSDFATAVTASVKKSANAIINICGFVLAFSVLIKMLDSDGFLSIASGKMSSILHTELHFSSALISGLFEIGNSLSQMQSLSASPLNIALAAFILGWGGISVHFQTLSLISETDIKTARYVIGRFFIAVLGSVTAFFAAVVLRI